MADDPEQRPLDYNAIRFPSDSVTLGHVRRAHPERFRGENAKLFEDLADDPDVSLNLVLYLERLLARAAYERARGSSTDVMAPERLDRTDCVNDLTECYATYGVATGAHQTEQLVRDMEAQAAAQAAGPKR